MSLRTPSTPWISLTRLALAIVRSLDACRSVRARWMFARSSPALMTTPATDSAIAAELPESACTSMEVWAAASVCSAVAMESCSAEIDSRAAESFQSPARSCAAGVNTWISLVASRATLPGGCLLSCTVSLAFIASRNTLIRRLRDVGGELALPRRGKRDPLGGRRHRSTAFRDESAGEHRPCDSRALQLGGEPDLAARIGHRSHDCQPLLQLAAPVLDRHHSCLGLRLGTFHESADLGSRGLGSLGQAPHLVRDDCEAATRITSSSGFDGRVQGEEVGLVRDVVDELEDALDLADSLRERRHALEDR